MIFWILIGLTVAVAVVFFIGNYRDAGLFEAFAFGGIALFFGGVVSFVVIAIVVGTTWNGGSSAQTGSRDDTLQALATGSSVEGRFFLGSGYINGVNVFNYIVDHGDYSTLEQAPADNNSKVYEDDETNPHVTVNHYDWNLWWVLPFPAADFETYDFHIPEGSITGGYEVKP